MKMNTRTMTWFLVFIWFIFMGVTAVSYGLGALYLPLNQIAQPFVCPNGQMLADQNISNPMPGTTITQVDWYCVDHQSGLKSQIVDAPIHLYAGAIYGLLMFAAALMIWYLYNRQIVWIQNIIKVFFVILIIFLILIPMLPLFRLAPTLMPTATPVPDATATALALTYNTLTAQTVSDFSPTDKPLADWTGIPIMPEAIAGNITDHKTYVFRIRSTSQSIITYYNDQLSASGWKMIDNRWQGMKFAKDQQILLVVIVPAKDMQSWIVTLVRVPS